MPEHIKEYIANYNSALSYLKLELKEPAIEALKRALSQVPDEERHRENITYLGILATLSFLLLEKRDFQSAFNYVTQGLAVKDNHADLLFVKSLLMLDLQSFDEMLEALIKYLLAIEESDAPTFDYKYIHEVALKEVFDRLIPTAYKYAFQHKEIRDIVERLCKATNNKGLIKAHEIMVKIDSIRSSKES